MLYVNNKSPWSAACLSFLFMNHFATWTCHFHGQMFQSSEWLWVRLPSDSTVICADLFVSRLSDSEKLEGRDYLLFMSSCLSLQGPMQGWAQSLCLNEFAPAFFFFLKTGFMPE